MNKDLARDIIRAAFRSGSELEALLPALKMHCSTENYASFVRQIAAAIDGIHASLVREVLARFPELEAEIEANIARTGRAMP